METEILLTGDNAIEPGLDLPIVHRVLISAESENTRKAIETDVRTIAEFMKVEVKDVKKFEDSYWKQWEPAIVSTFKQWLKDRYKPTTVKRKLNTLRTILIEASDYGLYPVEWLPKVLKATKVKNVTSEHYKAIKPDNQEKLLKYAASQPGLKGLRDYTIFRLLLETGMRRSELAQLKVKDIGKEDITIRKGKGNTIRTIPLTEDVIGYLLKWIKQSGQIEDVNNPLFPQVRKVNGEYIVINPELHLAVTSFNKLMKYYERRTNIDLTVHSFRATVVTDGLKAGMELAHMQRITGHKTIEMIVETYNRNEYNEPVTRSHDLPGF